MDRLRGIPGWLRTSTLLVLLEIHSASGISFSFDQDFQLWNWREARSDRQSPTLSSKKAYRLLSAQSFDPANLNKYWHILDTEDSWKERWNRLWKSDLTFRMKVFLWKVLNIGLYTNTRAKIFNHSNGFCALCPRQDETPNHMFSDCTFAQERWVKLLVFLLDPQSCVLIQSARSFLDIIDQCLILSPINAIRLNVVAETIWCSL